jgi:hypothetical protein
VGGFENQVPYTLPFSSPSKAALRRYIEAFLANWNDNHTPFVWTKSRHRTVRDHRKLIARISPTEH